METTFFETKNKLAVIRRQQKHGMTYYDVWIDYDKHQGKAKTYCLKNIDGIKSLTALIRACKDESNHFCPYSVTCDEQDRGNPSPPAVSSKPTTAGNLLYQIKLKQNHVKFFHARDSVLAVIETHGGKYMYHMPFDAYYKIMRFNKDCLDKNGYSLGIKKYVKLCKKYSYDKENK